MRFGVYISGSIWYNYFMIGDDNNTNKREKVMGLTNTEVNKLHELILKANTEQLTEAVQVFNTSRDMNALKAKNALSVGMHVEWTGKRGLKNGMITKIMKKNIQVETALGERWRVPASMVRKQETVTLKGI